VTKPSHLHRAETAIKLQQLAARGAAVAAEPSPPYCADCDKRDRPAPLKRLIAGWRCDVCKQVFVDVPMGEGFARWGQG
jgi:hypothetical protein